MVVDIDVKFINMYELIRCLTDALDLVDPRLSDHHRRVAYLAHEIARELGTAKNDQRDLVLAALLHDVGAFSLEERLEMLDEEPPALGGHALRGAAMLDGFRGLRQAANIIRYHHLDWKYGAGREHEGKSVPFASHILHLADRVAVKIRDKANILDDYRSIRDSILSESSAKFAPETVDAFAAVSGREYIWLDLAYRPVENLAPDLLQFDAMELDMDSLISLASVFSNIIDFRSPFTANHSAGVAKTAERLAELVGFSDNECKMMQIAGYLHDLGKLAVPKNVLEKPSRLDAEEFNIIKGHTFYTYRILQTIKGFETINMWASFHHERLDGNGYPFHLGDSELPLGSRIMAVADIFTAITEDRPYRKGMDLDRATAALDSMVEKRAVCPYVVSVLKDNIGEVNEIRRYAQRLAAMEYNYLTGSGMNNAFFN